MNDIITTAEELDALPVGSVFIDGLDNIGFRQEQGFLVPTGTWRDSMDKRSPTKWQTAEQVIRDSRAWGYDALPLTVLYRPGQPTEPARCAPSREEIVALFHAKHLDPCTGWCEKQAEAVQALCASQRTEAQVKAEAWEEAATWFDADLCGVSLIIRDRANRLSAAQPTPDLFEAMGLSTPEVPNVGGGLAGSDRR